MVVGGISINVGRVTGLGGDAIGIDTGIGTGFTLGTATGVTSIEGVPTTGDATGGEIEKKEQVYQKLVHRHALNMI